MGIVGWGRVIAAGWAAIGVAVALPAAAAADATISFTPPAGSYIYPAGDDFVVASGQPTFVIEADAGTSLVCSESGSSYAPCGAPPAGCAAAVCATYTPAVPWANATMHEVHVRALDAAGKTLREETASAEVDSRPPDTTARFETAPGAPARQPQLDVMAIDERGQSNNDTFQCALTVPGTPPAFAPCGQPLEAEATVAPAQVLALTYHPYAFLVRAVNVLGRPDPTPTVNLFSPMPCRLTAHRVTLRSYLARGLPVRIDCARGGAVAVQVFLRGFGGHDMSLRRAESIGPLNNPLQNAGTGLFTKALTVRPPKARRRQFRGHRSADVTLLAVNIDGVTGEAKPVTVRIR